MTIPATFTAYSIIQDAMIEAQLLRKGQVPDGEQVVQYLRRLTHMSNYWQTKGLKLFLWADLTLALVAGTTTYTMMPGGSVNIAKPLDIVTVYYADNQTPANTYELIMLAWTDWTMLSQRGTLGAVNSVFIDKQATQFNVSLYSTPNTQAATGTVHLVTRQQVTNPINITSTMAFPVEWGLAFLWGLADQICGGQPQAIMDRCRVNAERYRTELEDWDVEIAPTSIQPDSRSTMPSSFR